MKPSLQMCSFGDILKILSVNSQLVNFLIDIYIEDTTKGGVFLKKYFPHFHDSLACILFITPKI